MAANQKPPAPAWWDPRTFRMVRAQVPPTVRLVFRAAPGPATGMVLAGLLSAALPVAMAWVAKLIVDSVLRGQSEGYQSVGPSVIAYVGAECALMLASHLLGRLSALLRSVIGVKLGYVINMQILEKAQTLELQQFEDPVVYDRLQNARREASARPLNIFSQATTVVRDCLTLLSFSVVLFTFSPWVVLILFVVTLPTVLSEARFSKQAFELFTWRAPEGRRMRYFEWLLTRDNSVKEVRLYGLGSWLLGRYRALYERFFAEERSLATRRAIFGFLFGAVATCGFYGCYLWVAIETARGHLTLGEMTMHLSIFRQGQGSLRSVLGALGSAYEDTLFMSNLFGFFALPTRTVKPFDGQPRPESGFVLDHVSFRYPGAEAPALSNISLEIGPTERLALIGDNGAGKSTLIKLLVGLYQPTSGQIRLDGRPLETYDGAELRARIGVVLQDYVRYQFTADQNVGLGHVEDLDQRERIEAAGEMGGADAVVRDLAEGWDTQLGRWFAGGVELSAGQWQKLAISRAFMADAPIIVLDEPTASLDAEAEHALFERLKRLTEGRMAIMISHRFSTVRMADRIIVLRAGKLEEQGDHATLVEKGGRYAELFRLQAAGYLD